MTTTPAEIRSEAQRAMFERAAKDQDYAASRGISAEFAQASLDAHTARPLPPRAAGNKPGRAPPPRAPGALLRSRRAED